MNTIILSTLMSLAFPSAPTNAVIPEASITQSLGVDLADMESLTFTLGLVPHATNNPESDGAPIRREWIFRRRDMNFAWNALRLTRRGRGELDESATVDAKHVSFVFILK